MRYIEVITLLLSSWDIQVGCLSQKERRNQCTKHQFSKNIRQFQVLKMHALFECWRHFQKELDMLRTLAKRFLGSFVLIMDCANAFLAQGCEECKVLVQETAFATRKSIGFSWSNFVVASIWFLDGHNSEMESSMGFWLEQIVWQRNSRTGICWSKAWYIRWHANPFLWSQICQAPVHTYLPWDNYYGMSPNLESRILKFLRKGPITYN